MISQTAEYALRAMVFIAMNSDSPQVTEKIACGTKVPASYLSKILQLLAKSGLVKSQRGIGGGFILAAPPSKISILEIVNAVDPIKRIDTCPLDLSSHGVALCALHKRMDEAIQLVEQAFKKTTLREILSKPTKSIPLCETKLSTHRRTNH
ncbi:Rrf2 family transcriptional regulator [bacterium]|nr:Rrf2 family transcriptional regulator [bacterium]QQR56776.1 MAG: Rrf2 family transcriptional regulator [Candidatus Melainabacteria bacterium]